MKVLITDYAWPDVDIETQLLQQHNIQVKVANGTSESTLIQAASDVDAIMTNWATVGQSVIAASGKCRIVARMGIGLDNIDVAFCRQLNIPVTNVPDYCIREVAEHALALIYALGRKIGFYHHQTQSGGYDLSQGGPMFRMQNQTVGIIGLGRTSRELATLCLALGFKVLIASRSGQTFPGAQTVGLDFLLSQSDYVSVHLPLNDETRNYLSGQQFALMKATAYLINTARGGIVDHAALAMALQNGQIAGAGLDVQVPEPPDVRQAPYNDPRVIVTPHAAFVSQESLADLRRRATQQVIDRLTGRTPEHVVNQVAC